MCDCMCPLSPVGTVAIDLQDSSDSSPEGQGPGGMTMGSGGGGDGRASRTEGGLGGANTLALPATADSAQERRHSIAPVLELVDGVNSATFDPLGDQSEDEGGDEGKDEGDGDENGQWWGGRCE